MSRESGKRVERRHQDKAVQFALAREMHGDARADAEPRRDDTNLLGMNFLSSLKGWRVQGNYLVLSS